MSPSRPTLPRSALLRALAAAALDLVLPVTCAGCGAGPPVDAGADPDPGTRSDTDPRVCPTCARAWSQAPHRCEEGAARWDWLEPGGPPPVWALAVNEGSARRLVIAWKDRGRADVTAWLCAAAHRAGRWLAVTGRIADEAARVAGSGPQAAGLPGADRAPVARGPTVRPRGARPSAAPPLLAVPVPAVPLLAVPAVPAVPVPVLPPSVLPMPVQTLPAVPVPSLPISVPPLLVVPVPASPAGARRRGEDLVAAVAGAIADGLASGGAPAVATAALRLAGGGPDQVGLGARARAANRSGRVRLRHGGPAMVTGREVLLVDDVLTTGATLAACRRALEAAGARVRGGVVLAVTPLPGTRTDRLETRGDQG